MHRPSMDDTICRYWGRPRVIHRVRKPLPLSREENFRTWHIGSRISYLVSCTWHLASHFSKVASGFFLRASRFSLLRVAFSRPFCISVKPSPKGKWLSHYANATLNSVSVSSSPPKSATASSTLIIARRRLMLLGKIKVHPRGSRQTIADTVYAATRMYA
jgi:hypothetical protein